MRIFKSLKRLVLTVLIFFLASAAVLGYWQKDNITALIDSRKYSPEELAVRLDSKREELNAEVKKYTLKEIRDISAEDEEKLLKGQTTLEEISKKYGIPLDAMTGTAAPASQEALSGKVSEKPAAAPYEQEASEINSEENRKRAVDDAVSQSVSRMYAIKAKYISKIGELVESAVAEYKSLPASQRNDAAKNRMLTEKMGIVADLESQCDQEVSALLSELDKTLENLGADRKIIGTLKEAYKNEKSLKKSYYLSSF